MKIYFGQIYITPGIAFPFSFQFQRWLSEEITALVAPSAHFTRKYGDDWDLNIRISAKRAIGDNEIRGPSVFKKTKDVEFTVFLPFDTIHREMSIVQAAFGFLLQGVCSVLESMDIDITKIQERQLAMVDSVASDPTMVDRVSPTK